MKGLQAVFFACAVASAAGCASAASGGDEDLRSPFETSPAPMLDLAVVHDLAHPPGDLGATDLAQQPADAGGVACTTCTITLVGGTVAAKKSDGGDWDSGGLADPYVNLTLSSGSVKRSSTISDATTVSWNQVMFAGLSQAQVLAGFTVALMDEDPLNPDDTMATWPVTMTLAQLATGSLTLTSGTGPGMTTTITLTIK